VSCPARGEGPALVEALRVRALPEGGSDDLLEFLRLYRNAVQIVGIGPGAPMAGYP